MPNNQRRRFNTYEDETYVMRWWLKSAFDLSTTTKYQTSYNTAISAVKVSIERKYVDLKRMWCRNDFARLFKVRLLPIVLLYIAAALLFNFGTFIEK